MQRSAGAAAADVDVNGADVGIGGVGPDAAVLTSWWIGECTKTSNLVAQFRNCSVVVFTYTLKLHGNTACPSSDSRG